jgi:hypothetical protein
VDGYGDVSSGGSVNATGDVGRGLAPYRVNGTAVIDSSRNLLNIGYLSAGGNITTQTGNVGGAFFAAYSGGWAYGVTHTYTMLNTIGGGTCTIVVVGGTSVLHSNQERSYVT